MVGVAVGEEDRARGQAVVLDGGGDTACWRSGLKRRPAVVRLRCEELTLRGGFGRLFQKSYSQAPQNPTSD